LELLLLLNNTISSTRWRDHTYRARV